MPREERLALNKVSYAHYKQMATRRYLKLAFAKWGHPAQTSDDLAASGRGGVRQAIAAKAFQVGGDIPSKLQNSTDLWLRRGFYEAFQPASWEELVAAYEKDGEDLLEPAIWNDPVLRRYHENMVGLVARHPQLGDLFNYRCRELGLFPVQQVEADTDVRATTEIPVPHAPCLTATDVYNATRSGIADQTRSIIFSGTIWAGIMLLFAKWLLR